METLILNSQLEIKDLQNLVATQAKTITKLGNKQSNSDLTLLGLEEKVSQQEATIMTFNQFIQAYHQHPPPTNAKLTMIQDTVTSIQTDLSKFERELWNPHSTALQAHAKEFEIIRHQVERISQEVKDFITIYGRTDGEDPDSSMS
jgi:uncharacterized coiled-coil protein SlyX